MFLLLLKVEAVAPVDVTTLGIIPDDGLSDSAALAVAVEDYAELYFPPGTYELAETVYLPSNLRLIGANRESVIIKLAADTVAFRITGKRNVEISNMTLERPLDYQNSTEEMVFVYDGCVDIHLNQLRVVNQRSRGAAFSIIDSYNCAVTECVFQDVQLVFLEDGAWQVYGSAISWAACTGVLVEDCVVTESRDMVAEWLAKPAAQRGKYNWYQAGAFQVSHCINAVVRNNHVTTSGNGIDMGGTASALVEGNVLDQCHEAGIKLVNGSNGQTIRQNRVTRCGIAGIWLSAGSQNFSSRDNLVEDNIIGQIGQGIGGNNYWDSWFYETVPAGIHLLYSLTSSQRLRSNTITGNRFYETGSMRSPAVMSTGSSTISAINTIQSDNLEVAGNTANLTSYPVSEGYTLPSLSSFLIDSFDDDFERADGDVGTNYLLKDGAMYTVVSGQMENGGNGQNLSVIPGITLPDIEGYSRGGSFKVSIDVIVPSNSASSVPTFGVILNFQDKDNYHGVRFRGDSNAASYLQFFRRVDGVESVPANSSIMNLMTDSVSTGPYKTYRLEVDSLSPDLYRYSFRRIDWHTTALVGGTFDAAGGPYSASSFTGGTVGIYSDNASAGAYAYDNLVVEVVRPLESGPRDRKYSFFDDFNRADGLIGSDYTVGHGPEWEILNNEATLQNASDSYTYLNQAPLPSPADYYSGYRYYSSIDLFIGPTSSDSTPVLGLLLNYQDNENFSGIQWRGDGNNLVQASGRFLGAMESANITQSNVVTNFGVWYTLRVSSNSAGVYLYSLIDRSSQAVLSTGEWQPSSNGFETFTRGYIGLKSDAGGDVTYRIDNFRLEIGIPPTITSPLAVSARTGDPLIYQITATDSPTAFSSSGLPAGLSLDTETGVISGIPSAAGDAVVDITASNYLGENTKSLNFSISASFAGWADGIEPDSDEDGNGMLALLEYAFGAISPGQVTSSNRPVLGQSGGTFRLIYPVRADDPELLVVPVSTIDLNVDWSTSDISIRLLDTLTIDGVLVEMREASLPIEIPSQFMKIRITE